MEAGDRESADEARRSIERGLHEPTRFRAALLAVPFDQRDAWVDRVLGLDAIPDDGPDLPKGCVPYLPCPVEDLLRVVADASVTAADVFVDLGAGVGRAMALVHLLTGASALGVEIQAPLARAARELATRSRLPQLRTVEGDAAEVARLAPTGTVFFLYCPFGGERLARTLAALEGIARARPLRLACVDLPLPPCRWLTLAASPRPGVEVYVSAP